MFVSYAQNFEDLYLWRALQHVTHGFYIDVGAQDPTTDSVTRAFYERGWRGVNIEPVEQYFAALERQRPDDINICAVATSSSGLATLFQIPDTGLSTIDPENATRAVEKGYSGQHKTVKAVTLQEVWNAHHPADVHFLKIDVEGAETEVLKGIDLRQHRPWIVVVEATKPNSTVLVHDNWENLVTSS